MTMSFRRYITLDIVAIATMNSFVNAGYVWWLWRSSTKITLSGSDGIAYDLAGTPIWIAVLATLLGTGSVRRKLWEGKFHKPGFGLPAILQRLPVNIAARAAIMGLTAAVFVALPLWSLLQIVPVDLLALQHAVAAKGALTTLFSAAIVPVVVLAAISDLQPKLSEVRSAEHRSPPRSRTDETVLLNMSSLPLFER